MMDDTTGTVAKKADTTVETRQSENREAQKELTGAQEDTSKEQQAEKKAIEHACLSWTACYDDYCYVHRSEKEGSGWFPHGKNRKKSAKKDQDFLSIMDDALEGALDDEPVEVEHSDSEESTDSDIDLEDITEQQTFRMIALAVSEESIRIITNYWEEGPCYTCEHGTQHPHYYYNPGRRARDLMRIIELEYCQDSKCPTGEEVHIHQPTATLRIPLAIQKKIWKLREKSISMMIEHLGDVETEIDDRVDPEYVGGYFECSSTECEAFYEKHHHVWNIDPRHPDVALPRRTFYQLIVYDLTCEDPKCEWATSKHVHFSKNE